MTSNKLNTFHFSFNELKVDEERIFHLIGFDDPPVPEPYYSIVKHEFSALQNLSGICGGVKIFNSVSLDSVEKQLIIENNIFKIGTKLTTYFQKATSFAIILCTAGDEISIRTKKYSENGELLEGYVTDVIGSVIVETVADRLHQLLRKEFAEEGKGVTHIYSPGYCDWHVKEQEPLFALFPKGYCGITLNESMLMVPVKSMSGIFGIGKGVVERSSVCRDCDSKDCIYRKN